MKTPPNASKLKPCDRVKVSYQVQLFWVHRLRFCRHSSHCARHSEGWFSSKNLFFDMKNFFRWRPPGNKGIIFRTSRGVDWRVSSYLCRGLEHGDVNVCTTARVPRLGSRLAMTVESPTQSDMQRPKAKPEGPKAHRGYQYTEDTPRIHRFVPVFADRFPDFADLSL